MAQIIEAPLRKPSRSPQASPNTKAPTLRTLGLRPQIIVTSSSVTRGYDKKGLGKLGQWARNSRCNETCNERQRSNERVRQVAAFRLWTHTTLFASEFSRAMFPWRRRAQKGLRLDGLRSPSMVQAVPIGAVTARGLSRRETLDHDRSIRGSKSIEIVDVDGENQTAPGLHGGGNDVRIGKIF